jgi:hypothetical protein
MSQIQLPVQETKRPHSGYNGHQEWCLEFLRNDCHSSHGSIEADNNVVEADLSDSGLKGHLRDERTTFGESSPYNGLCGRIVSHWLIFLEPVDSHTELSQSCL